MSRSTQKNGALRASAAGAAGIGANPWQRIAVREPAGKWRTLPFAPVTVAEARELIGWGDYPRSRGCYMAQQRAESGETFLMFKGPQV